MAKRHSHFPMKMSWPSDNHPLARPWRNVYTIYCWLGPGWRAHRGTCALSVTHLCKPFTHTALTTTGPSRKEVTSMCMAQHAFSRQGSPVKSVAVQTSGSDHSWHLVCIFSGIKLCRHGLKGEQKQQKQFDFNHVCALKQILKDEYNSLAETLYSHSPNSKWNLCATICSRSVKFLSQYS